MPRGRPITSNVKENPEYFNEYYHNTNKEQLCECGCKYLFHSRRRHMLSKKHLNLIEFKKVREELESLKASI
jgi:hypothetical protein